MNSDFSHRIKVRLLNFPEKISECASSSLVVYGVDRWNEFKWFKHECNQEFQSITREFRFFKTLYLNAHLPLNPNGQYPNFTMNVIHDNTVISKFILKIIFAKTFNFQAKNKS